MSTILFDQALNPEQVAAVTAPDGPLLILAAAGTGKTRTLVYRVAYLSGKGVQPESILLLTFTNRAAREMMERAETLVGSGIGGMWGGTFHHMANRILRRHGPLIGYGSDFTILDRDDSRTLISECARGLKLQAREFPRSDVLLSLASASANTEKPLEQVVEERLSDGETDPADVLRVLGAYARKKTDLGAMDFDDLLVNCLRLLREHDRVVQHYQRHFRYVLVDEYQDTNAIQAELVDRLVEKQRNVFVVGDDFQSIYGWRGADFRNIMSFTDRYPDARTYTLETNYRSVPEILVVANACIAGNPDQYQKTLRPTREPYRQPYVARLRDGAQQARYVLQEVRSLSRNGYRYSDMAVLYRAHFHAMELEMELARQGIPYVIASGIRFFEQAHIKDVCSILKIVENPRDEIAFNRLLGLLPSVGPRTAARLWNALGGRFEARDAAQLGKIRKGLRPGAADGWEAIESVLTAYADESLEADVGEVVNRFVTAFYERHAANTFENCERRMDDIRELVVYTENYPGVEAFLSDVALLTNLDAELEGVNGAETDAIRLSTVHQAKGLEWSAVILLWMADGMFPSARSLNESEDGAAEERRLFYVAVTRAKDELCICVPELRRGRDGSVVYCQPSRFVEEIPAEYLREARPVLV